MSILEEVKEWLEGYEDEEKKIALEDLRRGGCINGAVGCMTLYEDTLPFFERNKEEINEILKQQGQDLDQFVFGILPAFDKEDALCIENQNQNLLAWYGFEEVARRYYEKEF